MREALNGSVAVLFRCDDGDQGMSGGPRRTAGLSIVGALGILLSCALVARGQLTDLALPVQISAGCGGCPIPVERLMREFQARKDATGDDRSQWPPAECGESKVHAPPFPPDGFYGGMLCDPRLMAQLVAEVNRQMRSYSGYTKFIVAPNNQLPEIDGQPDGPQMHSAEVLFAAIPQVNEVTASNYCQVADQLWDVVEQLRFVVIANSTAYQAGEGGNGRGRISVLGTGKSCLLTIGGDLGHECDEVCNVGPLMSAAFEECWAQPQLETQNLSQLGFWERAAYAGCLGPDNEDHCYCDTLGMGYYFGPLSFDSGQQRGRGHVFLKVGPPQEDAGISNRPPMAESYMDLFRHYGTFDVPATGLGAWSRDVQGSPYGFTRDANGAPLQGVAGWKVDSDNPIVAVLEPYYNRKPDSAASGGCMTCVPGKVTASLDGVHVKIALGRHEQGSAGYLLVRGDTLVGWGEEMVQPDANNLPMAGSGAHELRTPAGVSYHGPNATTLTVTQPYRYLRQVLGPSVNVNILPSTGGFTVGTSDQSPSLRYSTRMRG